MIEIRTLYRDEYGKKRATGLGDIHFDSNGIAKVEDEVGKKLCMISSSLELVKKDGQLKEITTKSAAKPEAANIQKADDVTSLPTPLKEEVTPNDNLDVDISDTTTIIDPPIEEDEESQVLREVLSEKSISELRELCQEAGVEGYEVFKGPKGKTELVNFMVDKKVGL